MTTYPAYHDYPTIEAWLNTCDRIAATDPTAQRALRAQRQRLAAERAQHAARMAAQSALERATVASLKEAEVTR